MNNNELIISQIRQRLEILYQLVEKLEEEGGGGGGEGGTTDYLDLTNKPSIGGVALVGNKTIDQLGGVLAGTLARVATSGSYEDLLDKPTIPAAQVPADWNATSGVSRILNKPTIPAAQVNSDWNATSGVARILNKPTLSTVATSGSYNDLSNRPTIDSNLSTTSTNAVQNRVLTTQIGGLVDKGAKNLLEIILKSQTINGLTITVNEGIITINGTASANTNLSLTARFSISESVVLSGVTGGSTATYFLYHTGYDVNAYYQYNTPVYFNNLSNTGSIYLIIRSGTVFNNTVIRPMLCTRRDYEASSAFVPYVKSNSELTKDILSIKPSIIDNTGESTSITIGGINSSTNSNCLLLCTNRRSGQTIKDAVILVTRYTNTVRATVIAGDITPTISISGDIITLSGLTTYLSITALSPQAVIMSVG